MFSEVVLDEARTYEVYGYSPKDLSSGSHSKVIVKCTACLREIHRQPRDALRKHSCPVIEGSLKRCFKCKEWKPLESFSNAGKGRTSKVCKDCFNQYDCVKGYEKNRRTRFAKAIEEGDFEFYLKRRFPRLKSGVLQKGIDFDLTMDFLLDLWDRQNGKCYYTEIPMSNLMKQNGFQAWDAPSIDRLDPQGGYVQKNVVWCISAVNCFKQQLTADQFREAVSSSKWWFER